MYYVDQDETHISAECQKCGKVIKIPKENCITFSNAYILKPPFKCDCGKTSDIIEMETLVPRCPTCGSKDVKKISGDSKVGKAILFGIFALGAISKTYKCNNCGYQW